MSLCCNINSRIGSRSYNMLHASHSRAKLLLLSLFANAAQGNRWRQANGGNMRRALACSTTATNFDFTKRSVLTPHICRAIINHSLRKDVLWDQDALWDQHADAMRILNEQKIPPRQSKQKLPQRQSHQGKPHTIIIIINNIIIMLPIRVRKSSRLIRHL